MKGNSAEPCYSGSHNVHICETQHRINFKNIMTETINSRSKWPAACQDWGLEYPRGHCCLSVVSAVCCHVEVTTICRSLLRRSPTGCVCVCVCVCVRV